MLTRKLLVSVLVVALFALGVVTPALAEKPFEWLIMEENEDYDNTFSCGDFDVRVVGSKHMTAKIKHDEQWNILRNNAQTGFTGTLTNMTTGKYLIERAHWTWNMAFENNISTKSVLAGSQYLLKESNGRVIWLDKGVMKYVGIYIDLINGILEFTEPYHVAGNFYFLEGDLGEAICDALR